MVAFTRSVSESLGEERKWVHYGLTSTDVVDTANSYLVKQANVILRRDLQHFRTILKEKAQEHKYTIMMGRTHGIHAEPTTFGLKLALWYAEMGRHLERFDAAATSIEVGKISGAVGTYANIDPFVERYVCEKLGLEPAPISTQTLQRDRHAHYLSTLALIATSLEKFATEIRALQKSEVREVEEYFSAGQTGSSAMPHKRNPIGSENITGLARVMRGYMVTAYENVSLWHERDISHSSAERIIIPDSTTLLNYMLNRFSKIIKELTVFPETMQKNMDHSLGLVFSQQVMLALINQGVTREEAYEIVQPLAMDAWSTQSPFLELVLASTRVGELLSEEAIKSCFDYNYHVKYVDVIFKRLKL